jgi:putative ABC transport system substrate-binding protein
LDRRPKHPDRLSLGRGQRRCYAQARRGAGRVILAHSSAAVAPLLQESRTIPIVFTLVAAPVGAGYVSNLARPGGNVKGFTNFEYSIGGKWLELLKAIAPNVKRVAVLRESFVASGPGQFGAIQAASDSLGVEVRPLDLRDADEIERDITAA